MAFGPVLPKICPKNEQMKKSPFLLVLLPALLFWAACSPWKKVYSEEEPGANLYKYHTFNWLDNQTTRLGNSGPEWLTAGTQSKIRAATEEQLARFGFKPCDENPDLMLHYHVVVKNEVLYVPDHTCNPRDEQIYARCNRVRPVQYREGTLIIDFIDTKNGNQVWRGAVVSGLENMGPKEADSMIKAAVEAIFKKFPERPIRFVTR